MTRLSIAACGLLALSACRPPAPVSSVTVRNVHLGNPRVVSAGPGGEVARQWAAKIPVDGASVRRWTYTLDVAKDGAGERWRYDPEGYVQVLTIARNAKVYRLPDPARFNRALGIAE